jgi:hypothetical protein
VLNVRFSDLRIIVSTFVLIDGLEPTSSSSSEGNQHLQITQRILTNTTESFLTFTAAKLALASVLEPNNLRLIPALSGLFILGYVHQIPIPL